MLRTVQVFCKRSLLFASVALLAFAAGCFSSVDMYENATQTEKAGDIPDIAAMQGKSEIPSGIGSYNFGTLKVGSSSPAVTFTVENIGTSDLTLTGVSLTEGDLIDFALDASSTAFTVPPDGYTTFTVIFTPQNYGEKKRNLVINCNDPDESSYSFCLLGYGI